MGGQWFNNPYQKAHKALTLPVRPIGHFLRKGSEALTDLTPTIAKVGDAGVDAFAGPITDVASKGIGAASDALLGLGSSLGAGVGGDVGAETAAAGGTAVAGPAGTVGGGIMGLLGGTALGGALGTAAGMAGKGLATAAPFIAKAAVPAVKGLGRATVRGATDAMGDMASMAGDYDETPGITRGAKSRAMGLTQDIATPSMGALLKGGPFGDQPDFSTMKGWVDPVAQTNADNAIADANNWTGPFTQQPPKIEKVSDGFNPDDMRMSLQANGILPGLPKSVARGGGKAPAPKPGPVPPPGKTAPPPPPAAPAGEQEDPNGFSMSKLFSGLSGLTSSGFPRAPQSTTEGEPTPEQLTAWGLQNQSMNTLAKAQNMTDRTNAKNPPLSSAYDVAVTNSNDAQSLGRQLDKDGVQGPERQQAMEQFLKSPNATGREPPIQQDETPFVAAPAAAAAAPASMLALLGGAAAGAGGGASAAQEPMREHTLPPDFFQKAEQEHTDSLAGARADKGTASIMPSLAPEQRMRIRTPAIAREEMASDIWLKYPKAEQQQILQLVKGKR